MRRRDSVLRANRARAARAPAPLRRAGTAETYPARARSVRAWCRPVKSSGSFRGVALGVQPEMNLCVHDQHCVPLSPSLRILPERTAATSSDFAGQAARLFSCFHAAFPWWPNPVPRRRLLSQPPSRCSAAVSRETRLGPASLEPDAHQRLRAFVAEHPSSIHPRVSLVIDAGTPHLRAGAWFCCSCRGQRSRHLAAGHSPPQRMTRHTARSRKHLLFPCQHPERPVSSERNYDVIQIRLFS